MARIGEYPTGTMVREFLYRTNTSKFRHCEEGALPGAVRLKPYQGRCPDDCEACLWQAISNIVSEIASGEYALAHSPDALSGMTGCTVEKRE